MSYESTLEELADAHKRIAEQDTEISMLRGKLHRAIARLQEQGDPKARVTEEQNPQEPQ